MQADDGDKSTLRVMLLPPLGDDPRDSRTVLMMGARPRAGQALYDALRSESVTRSAVLLVCDSLLCVDVPASSAVTGWLIALITTIVVVLALVAALVFRRWRARRIVHA